MRVALVCPYSLSVPGGVQGQVLGLSRAFRHMGIDARVIAPCDGPPPDPSVIAVGTSRDWPFNGSVASVSLDGTVARRTLQALKSFRPDVIHLHEPMVGGPTAIALLGGFAPKVGTFHAAGYQIPGRRLLRKPFKGMANRLTIRTAVSEEARISAEQHFGGGHYWIIPNGVDVEGFRNAQPWEASKPVVIFVGRHEQRKGLPVLLDAFAQFEGEAELWIIGTGPQTSELQTRDIPNAHWLGMRGAEEVRRRMRAASILCAPSLYGESFGVVLLEGMASGAVVVASDIPGYHNVVEDAGVLVPPSDADALCDALSRVLSDPDLAATLKAKGDKRVEGFSFAALARRYIPIYESAAMIGAT